MSPTEGRRKQQGPQDPLSNEILRAFGLSSSRCGQYNKIRMFDNIVKFIEDLLYTSYVEWAKKMGVSKCVCRTPADEAQCVRYH